MSFFILRHGQANGDPPIERYRPHAPLMLTGIEQAHRTGRRIGRYLKTSETEGPVVLYHSDFRRAQQTADAVATVLGSRITTRIEDPRLVEQHFGIFDCVTYADQRLRYPEESARISAMYAAGDRYLADFKDGESGPIVTARLKKFFEDTQAYEEKNGPTTFIVVTHGTTSNLLTMLLMDYDKAWYAKAVRPEYCETRFIQHRNGQFFDMGTKWTHKKLACDADKGIVSAANVRPPEQPLPSMP